MSYSEARQRHDERGIEAQREELSYLLGERGDVAAVLGASVARDVAAGNRVDYHEVAELRGALEEIDAALDRVEQLPEN
jgi:hypothetical protein